ncbi:MAG: ATP-binding protein [Chloroflexota bacterium]
MTQERQRSVKIHIPSELGYEKVPMGAVAVIARRMAFADDKIEDLKTAVSEACTNAIEHGNDHKLDASVTVVVKFDQAKIRVDVIDDGHQPLPNEIPDRADRNDFRGMGLFLISALMDSLEMTSRPGQNVVRLTCQNPALVSCA